MPLSPGEGLVRTGTVGPSPLPAVVTRSDTTGVWCTAVDGDQRHPLGPCKGATRLAAVTTGVDGTGVHTHPLTVERLPVRTRVLLLLTDDGPWVLTHDREVTA